ncbi:MAG: ABC transporter permease [Acidimicrobiales bacterium]
MRPALLIAGKDLRLRFRDRSALVLGFVAPLAIATVMSFAFGGAADFHVTVVVVDRDGGDLAAALTSVLRSDDLQEILTVETADSVAEASRTIDDGDAQAGLVIPEGFTDAVAGPSPKGFEVLTSVDDASAGQVVRSIASSFTAQLDADRLSVATALAAGAPADDLEALVAAATEERLPVALAEQDTGARPLTALSYYAPGMGIFFLFFAISFTARGWYAEAREGTLERMAAAASTGQILLGKAISVFAYGLASLGTMALVTSVVFGADWGGPLPAATLITAVVLSVVCLTAFVIVVARTERQAEGLSSMLVFGLALLGGNFVVISGAPVLLRRLALLTPNGWALRGFVDVSTGPHAMAAVWTPLAGILAFSAVVAAITAALARRMELP